MASSWSAAAAGVSVALALGPLACASPAPVVAPGAVPSATCPLEGCDAARTKAIESAASPGACASAGDAPCAGAPPAACRARALSAWSDAHDDRSVACLGRMLLEACDLGDAPACSYAGRMTLEGDGLDPDEERGLAMLDRACAAGERIACQVGVRWLADANHRRGSHGSVDLRELFDVMLDCLDGNRDQCWAAASDYATGSNGFPRDAVRSSAAYERACTLGHVAACNNLGDAFEYGNGVRRDLAHAGELYERACRMGEALACGNLGHLVENGEGRPRDLPRARQLYRDACAAGSLYGCLHQQMSAVDSPATPEQAARTLERFQRACDARDGRACAFVGIMYEDGPDGLSRDEDKSSAAMKRACTLHVSEACAWVLGHS